MNNGDLANVLDADGPEIKCPYADAADARSEWAAFYDEWARKEWADNFDDNAPSEADSEGFWEDAVNDVAQNLAACENARFHDAPSEELWDDEKVAQNLAADENELLLERLSHRLVKQLRWHSHHLVAVDDDGYYLVSDVLALGRFKGITVEAIKEVVASDINNSKRGKGARLELREHTIHWIDGGDGTPKLTIRAAYKETKEQWQQRQWRPKQWRQWSWWQWQKNRPRHCKGCSGSGFSKIVPRSGGYDDYRTPASPAVAEIWEPYVTEDGRPWYWNPQTEEFFFSDDTSSGWSKLALDPQRRPHWFHGRTGRFFIERLQ